MRKLLTAISMFIIFSGCAQKPVNLSEAKADVQFYYESGAYQKEVAEILDDAASELFPLENGLKNAAVFDVDETVLSNYKYARSLGFGYKLELWNDWLFKAEAEPIPGVKTFYDLLTANGVKVIFLTGRYDETCEATLKNLINAGFTEMDTLICRPHTDLKISTAQFKEGKRKVLTDAGYNIIVTVGDQKSDIEGDYTGLKVKLPNYLYLLD